MIDRATNSGAKDARRQRFQTKSGKFLISRQRWSRRRPLRAGVVVAPRMRAARIRVNEEGRDAQSATDALRDSLRENHDRPRRELWGEGSNDDRSHHEYGGEGRQTPTISNKNCNFLIPRQRWSRRRPLRGRRRNGTIVRGARAQNTHEFQPRAKNKFSATTRDAAVLNAEPLTD